MPSVLIVEGRTILAEGLRAILVGSERFEWVEVARTLAEAWAVVETRCPEVVLIDVDLADAAGFALARRLRRQTPRPHVVFLSAWVNPEFVVGAIAAGARGYVVEEDPPEVLIDALTRVAQGERVFTREVRRIAIATGHSGGTDVRASDDVLTDRERDVMQSVATGSTWSECAEALGLTVPSVRTLWNRAQEKLGLRDVRRTRMLTVDRDKDS